VGLKLCMEKFNNTFKTHLNILLNLYRNYCFTQSGKENEFTKEVGDNVQFFYEKGYFMSYTMGIAESCKSVIFTQEKIDELKKLGDEKMRKEANKIQTKLTSESHKIIKESVIGYKQNNEFFKSQLERHNLIMDGFFFITSESKDFLRLSSSLSASSLRDESVSLSLSISRTPSISSSQDFSSLIASTIGTRSECSLDRFNLISIFISLSNNFDSISEYLLIISSSLFFKTGIILKQYFFYMFY